MEEYYDYYMESLKGEMIMVKIFTYFDEWITKYIDIHKNLEFPYNWIIPILEFCLLVVISHYIRIIIPKTHNI